MGESGGPTGDVGQLQSAREDPSYLREAPSYPPENPSWPTVGEKMLSGGAMLGGRRYSCCSRMVLGTCTATGLACPRPAPDAARLAGALCRGLGGC